MKYRLWDTDINRLFGTFATEDEALALVRVLLTSYSAVYADDLAMGGERADGSPAAPLTGAALVELAWRAAGKHEPDPGAVLTGDVVAAARLAR